MEEYVGQIWHKLVVRASEREYPEAAVHLEDVRSQAALFFRALGGDGGLRVTNSQSSANRVHRSFLQKMAGTGKTTEFAVRDAETLQLPFSIAHFDDPKLNRKLYIWLVALASVPFDRKLLWIERSRQQTKTLLLEWPGLEKLYFELVAAHLDNRGALEKISREFRSLEKIIRCALENPFDVTENFSPNDKLWLNVPLWMHPFPPMEKPTLDSVSDAPADDDNDSDQAEKPEKDEKRHKAESVETPDGRDGLLAFRLESLFSWTDFLKVDRTTDEDEDDNGLGAANDMEVMSVSRDKQSLRSRLKLDLDLPSESHDDLRLGPGIPLPEWDHKQNRLLKDHCRLQNMIARDAVACEIPPHLRSQARQLRRHFESLRSERQWLRQQNDGTEIDLDAYISFQTRQSGEQFVSDDGLYRELRKSRRDLSCLLLADLSLSTDTYVNDESRVIDLIRDSLFLFAEALTATNDRFAIHGFSSRRRDHIRFHQIKGFNNRHDGAVRGRIAAIKPGYYTRMGAAIRYSTRLLEAEGSTQKLLLILTDGKPNDLDKYEGRYGIEDTREALREARAKGLEPFCVTIDEKARDYLPYLFGNHAYVQVKKLEELPRKLPLLYARLTT